MYDPNPAYHSQGGAAASAAGRHHSIPLEILDDLASRFIINAPEGEKSDLIRVCFQVRSLPRGRLMPNAKCQHCRWNWHTGFT